MQTKHIEHMKLGLVYSSSHCASEVNNRCSVVSRRTLQAKDGEALSLKLGLVLPHAGSTPCQDMMDLQLTAE